VIHTYLDYNIVAIQKQLTGIVSLIRTFQERIHLYLILHIALIMQLYDNEIMITAMKVNTFLTTLMDELN
jgi:hypothetical protein